MEIKIDRESNIPLYKQIAIQIQRMIADREMEGGQKIPSLRKLASSLEVNVITVKKAYEELKELCFVGSQHGKGYFVLPEAERIQVEGEIERYLKNAVELAVRDGFSVDRLIGLLKKMYKKEVFETCPHQELKSLETAIVTDPKGELFQRKTELMTKGYIVVERIVMDEEYYRPRSEDAEAVPTEFDGEGDQYER